MYFVQGALHDALCRDAAVFLQNGFLQGAAVDPHPDGNLPLFRRLHHGLHLVRAADVAGIDADFVRTVLHGGDGHLVVEMDVSHQRDMNLAFDLGQRPGGLPVRHRTADDLAARLLQPVDLRHGGLDVLGPGIRHGLDQDRAAAAYLPGSYLYFPGVVSMHGSLLRSG